VPRRAFLFPLLLSLLFCACIKKKEIKYVSDETLVRTQITRFEDALKQKNPELLSDYYSRDKIEIFPFWDKESLTSWEEAISYWKEFFEDQKVTDFVLSSVTVTTAGRTAWTKGNWEMKIEKKKIGKKKKQYQILQGRYSAIFENHEGNWQVVHEHMSMPESKL